MAGYVATARVEIEASPERVWQVLLDPVATKEFMFGSEVETDWQAGSPITWTGEYEGKAYQDKGKVLAVEPGRRLQVTHYSPMSGQPDVPENYHTLTYELSGGNGKTQLSLSQDNNASEEEAEHSRGMWEMLVQGVKKVAESG
ncbi:ATPase [Kribbella sp. ALI-6-A]|uniref:SRPBCC domain-containing protein n=1 Tax=Kribbella sp. ALI-6-A TaxID=1933817 RepID=UPI00097C7D1E|nr:SRPBCC domain-containing protein [Kribbella sp. ALI-6-A]ONI71687.1 ATPase [Kribbella sp. ALI-6-A]